jgi:hypothetical protein
MAIVFSQDTVEIAVVGLIGFKPHVNVWHMHALEDPTTSDVDAVKDFANNWQDHLIPLMNRQYKLQHFAWRSIDPDDNNTGVLSPDLTKAIQGPDQALCLPFNTAYLIHKRTQNRPRGRRDGRMFLSGVSEGKADDYGEVLDTTQAAWNTALAAFLEGITDVSVTSGKDQYPVVLETTPASRAPGAQPVTVAGRRINRLVMDRTVASQRDRLR